MVLQQLNKLFMRWLLMFNVFNEQNADILEKLALDDNKMVV